MLHCISCPIVPWQGTGRAASHACLMSLCSKTSASCCPVARASHTCLVPHGDKGCRSYLTVLAVLLLYKLCASCLRFAGDVSCHTLFQSCAFNKCDSCIITPQVMFVSRCIVAGLTVFVMVMQCNMLAMGPAGAAGGLRIACARASAPEPGAYAAGRACSRAGWEGCGARLW